PERAATGGRRLTAEDVWAIPRVGAPVPSPDGASFAVAVTTHDMELNRGRSRIWLAPVAGGEPRALTSNDVSSSEPAFSAAGKRLAFVRKGDDGKGQIHVLPREGGGSQRIPDMPLR